MIGDNDEQFKATLTPQERAFFEVGIQPGNTVGNVAAGNPVMGTIAFGTTLIYPPVEAPFFVTKDSGKRENLASGMVRDTEDGKTDYSLIHAGPMYDRWAELLTRGAVKYGRNNWTKALAATDPAERETTKARFQRSAARHMRQWMRGDRDEDHAAAVVFNLNGYEAMCATDPKEPK